MSLSWSTIGPSLAMFIPSVSNRTETATQILQVLTTDNPFSFAGRDPNAGLKLHKKIENIAEVLAFREDVSASFTYYWDADKPEAQQRSTEETPVEISPFTAVNTPRFRWDGRNFLILYGFLHHVLKRGTRYRTEEEIVFRELFLADRFKRVVNVLEPAFAFLDQFGKAVFKPDRRHVDLRQFAWGATIYSREDAERIGVDKLESSPAWRVEDLPWGGFCVQLAQNPFQAGAKTRQEVQRHLNLKEVFAGKAGPMQLEPGGKLL